MKTKNILIGGLVGAVVFFLLGWAIYGLLLMDFMSDKMNQCMMLPEEEMNLVAMFFSNFALALLIAFILSWGNVTDMMGGAKVGAIFGFLTALSTDLSFYAMSTMFSDITAMFVDIAVFTIMSAITGLVMAKVMNMGQKAAA